MSNRRRRESLSTAEVSSSPNSGTLSHSVVHVVRVVCRLSSPVYTLQYTH